MIPDKIRLIQEGQLKKDIPELSVGDTVKVHVKIVEDEKTRMQAFEGTLISVKGEGVSRTITLRRVSYNVGVERIFPVNSPFLGKVEVVRHGKTKRAKLYFLRERIGKRVGLEEKRDEEQTQ